MTYKKSGLAVLLILGVMLASFLPAFSQQEESTIRIGVIPLVEQLPLAVAQKEVESSQLKSKIKLDVYNSWTALEAAFRTGAVEAAAITLPKALIMAYEGIPLKILLVVSRNGSAIVLSGDDVKGKIVGGSGNDTIDLVVFDRYLKQKNLKLNYDVKFLLIPFAKAVSLLKEERIYGFCLPAPYAALAEKEGVGRKIILSKDIFPNHIASVLIINPNVLRDEKNLVKEYLKILIKAQKSVEKDKDDSKGQQTALAQVDSFKLAPEIVVKSLIAPKDRVVFGSPAPSVREVEEIMQDIMLLGVMGGKVNLKELIDTQYID